MALANDLKKRLRTCKLSKIDEEDDKEDKAVDKSEQIRLAERDNKYEEPEQPMLKKYHIKFEIDPVSSLLFAIALATRLLRLEEPRAVVFDELHYGKYVGLYLQNTFFFDPHPPLGKLLIAGAAKLTGYDGQFKFDRIGSVYNTEVPLITMRLVPALFGSLLIPVVYNIGLELGLKQGTAVLAAFLVLCDNAMLTQSRFILMESLLIFFGSFGIFCIIKCVKNTSIFSPIRWLWLILGSAFLTCGVCVKYAGGLTWLLGMWLLVRNIWQMLPNKNYSVRLISLIFVLQGCFALFVSVTVYVSVFYIHLHTLYKAGPHDSIMTSAFQASLEGGLASITRGQPLQVSHGSQVTLRHTHGRACWLHSHAHVYPVRYPDGRGSSHQQQVTCYSFKDVNNWWILKRPNRNDLVVDQVDPIKHGDIIQVVHGITSRALNSHDVAAPVTPQHQEVSCYIDYNVSMSAQNLWRVEIVNLAESGPIWHTIQSQVRLIHVNSSQGLKFSGRQLPDWGFNQHEVVTDRVIDQPDTVWNVEEHRYTRAEDSRDRERELVQAEMIPMQPTQMGFWPKFLELQRKMIFSGAGSSGADQGSHMYASEPSEWPLMARSIAYWISPRSNAQIHLLGNVAVWWAGSLAIVVFSGLLVFHLLRRRRLCFDMSSEEWCRFVMMSHILLLGYFLHYIPYFLLDTTLFLHHYLPAFVFKTLLLAGLVQHIIYLLENRLKLHRIAGIYKLLISFWCLTVVWIFRRFSVLSYGNTDLNAVELNRLRWRESWHFILHKE